MFHHPSLKLILPRTHSSEQPVDSFLVGRIGEQLGEQIFSKFRHSLMTCVSEAMELRAKSLKLRFLLGRKIQRHAFVA